MQDVDAIVAEAASQFAAIDDLPQLENAKARYLGKQGVLTELLKGLRRAPARGKARPRRRASTTPRTRSNGCSRRAAR